MTRPLWFAVLPAALLLAGCPTSGAHTRDLPVRLTMHPADTVALGDSVRLTAWLRNPGPEPVRLEFEDDCQVEFYVHAPDRTVLHPPGGGTACVGGPTVVEVPAADSLRYADVWLAASPYLGAHSAYAVLWEHHVPSGDERRYKAGHRSNVLEFQLVMPPE